MSRPLVSIITPTYNQADYVSDCISSVLAQSYDNWELLIVDDGSTDNTIELARSFVDPRVKIHVQSNLGIWKLSETYNSALDMAQGELVAVLEGDDYWVENKLRSQVSSLADPRVVMSWGRATAINDAGNLLYSFPKQKMEGAPVYCNRPVGSVLDKLLLGNFIPACTVMFRREALTEVGGFQQPVGVPYVDYPTYLRMALSGEFRPLDTVLGFWRRHDRQASELMLARQVESARNLAIETYGELRGDHKRVVTLVRDDIERSYRELTSSTLFERGRIALMRSNWGSATKDFSRALRSGRSARNRTKAVFGLLAAWLHTDLERFARFGRSVE